MSYDFGYSLNAFSFLYLVLPLHLESFKNITIQSWLPVFLQQVNFITESDSLQYASYYNLQQLHFFQHHSFAFATLLYICYLSCTAGLFFFCPNNRHGFIFFSIFLWDCFLKSVLDKFRKTKHCLMSTGRTGASQVCSIHLKEAAVLQHYITRSLAPFIKVLFPISAKFLFLDFHILKVCW